VALRPLDENMETRKWGQKDKHQITRIARHQLHAAAQQHLVADGGTVALFEESVNQVQAD